MQEFILKQDYLSTCNIYDTYIQKAIETEKKHIIHVIMYPKYY